MIDKAESWVTCYPSIRKNVDWDDFIIDLNARFKDAKGVNMVEQFNKLQHESNHEEYLDEYERLRSVMLQNGHVLPDDYILDSFIGGLKPTIKPFVKAFKLTSIADAIESARLQEEQLSASTPINLSNLVFSLIMHPNLCNQ